MEVGHVQRWARTDQEPARRVAGGTSGLAFTCSTNGVRHPPAHRARSTTRGLSSTATSAWSGRVTTRPSAGRRATSRLAAGSWQPECVITIKPIALDDLREVMAAIDRSEHVGGEYAVVDGRLVERPVTISDIPPLDPVGDGPHSVAAKVQFCSAVVAEHGGVVLGAYAGERVAGVAVVAPCFEPAMAWFAYLDVNRADRRHGVASALWEAAVHHAQERGARQMYVSATPTRSAVGFYLSRGCRLADPVHAGLFEHEPDDIHLVADLG